MITRCSYRKRGFFLADAPLAIWVVILFLFLPLLDFGAVLLRCTFLYMAVHNAARNASRAPSFLNPVNGQQSAAQMATNTVSNTISMWNGVSASSTICEIVTTNVSTDTVSRQSSPLGTPADDENNTYQIEVTVVGTVSPLVTFYMPWFGHSIPGLTKPITLTMSDRQYVENPQGLVL